MKVVSIYEAKTQLSKLVEMVLAGQEVVIAKRKTPLVSLHPIRSSKTRRKTGALPGLVISMTEAFNDSLDDWAEEAGFPDGATSVGKRKRALRR
jgi:antitoxin (DNA-binding transcriptional repressor) of toxin-antitoxin stability system